MQDKDDAAPLRGKLVIVGDDETGKTCLLMRHGTDQFPTDHVPKVYSLCYFLKKVDGKTVQLHIWDTSGSVEYRRFRPMAYPDTNVFCLCFDVASKQSFENVKTEWIVELTHHCPGVPVLLVGCRIDLRTNEVKIKEMNDKGLQFITESQGHEMAAEIGAVKYVECSALTGEGVDHLFQQSAELAKKHMSEYYNRKNKCRLL